MYKKQNSHENQKTQKKYNIILIDDEQFILKELKNRLDEEGYNVKTFSDAADALTSIKALTVKSEISVIVSDQRMRYLSGIDFFTCLEEKKLLLNTSRIILTAFDDKQTIIKAIEKAQIFSFISKESFDLDEICLIIKRAVEAYDYKKEKAEYVEYLEREIDRLNKLIEVFQQKNQKNWVIRIIRKFKRL